MAALAAVAAVATVPAMVAVAAMASVATVVSVAAVAAVAADIQSRFNDIPLPGTEGNWTLAFSQLLVFAAAAAEAWRHG